MLGITNIYRENSFLSNTATFLQQLFSTSDGILHTWQEGSFVLEKQGDSLLCHGNKNGIIQPVPYPQGEMEPTIETLKKMEPTLARKQNGAFFIKFNELPMNALDKS